MEEGVIQAQAMAARIACARMTMLHLTALHDSRRTGLRPCGQVPVGPQGGDGEAAALEMERHLRILLYMRRLALPGGQPTAGETVT